MLFKSRLKIWSGGDETERSTVERWGEMMGDKVDA